MNIVEIAILGDIAAVGAAYVVDQYVLWPRKLSRIIEMENLYRERYRTEPPERPPEFLNRGRHSMYYVREYERLLREATSY
jgi:hypothetical protein